MLETSLTTPLTLRTYTGINCTTKVEQTIVKQYVVVSELGTAGASAYEIALSNGFVGTQEEWLDSLKAKNYIRRHDFVSNISYCGFAELGSLESDSVWNISKIVVSVFGTTTTTHATNVDWIGHLTHIYV